MLVAQPGTDSHVDRYVEECLENVKELANSGNYSFGLDSGKEIPVRQAIGNQSSPLGEWRVLGI